MAETRTRWTHPSVLELGGGSDPLVRIADLARRAVYDAIEGGWTGPPFDPFALAKLRGVDLLPREDVPDARTVSAASRLTIEFNPNQPRWRMRYSVAHELAHTLFADVGDEVRNRAKGDLVRADHWQLELLCNVAAAELLMPIGTFRDLAGEPADIRTLMDARKRYDVSAEALLLRFTKLTDFDCAAFAAARHKDKNNGRYRLDYLIPSKHWNTVLPVGVLISASSKIADCTGVGYTTTADEVWLEGLAPFHVECVGIPPYPGSRYPRVVGLIAPVKARAAKPHEPLLKFVDGNALEPRGDGYKIIAHVVNDKTANWGGAGFATALRSKYPEVQAEFRAWASSALHQLRLGNLHVKEVESESNLAVAHLVAQHGYGPSAKPRIRYEALERGLAALGVVAMERRATIHIPRIGSGQAGGSWNVIEELIDQELCARGIRVTVYDLPS